MIVFILMLIKIVASLFQFLSPPLRSFSAISIPMLFVWSTDDSAVEFLAFKSVFLVVIFGICLLSWIVTPWFATSNKRGVAIVGLSFVVGLNVFDIISCILSALTTLEKALSLSFSVLIILLSIRTIYKVCKK